MLIISSRINITTKNHNEFSNYKSQYKSSKLQLFIIKEIRSKEGGKAPKNKTLKPFEMASRRRFELPVSRMKSWRPRPLDERDKVFCKITI